MRTISDHEAQGDLQQVLDSAQNERVVITRRGKPAAVVLGLESYDEETWRRPARRSSGG